MEQVEEGLDAGFVELIHHIAVVVKPCLADLRRSVGEDAGPGDREAETVKTQLLHHLDVLGIAVVEIRSLIRVCALVLFGIEVVVMLAYILALAALVAAGFDLAGGAGCAEQEILGECKFHKNILRFIVYKVKVIIAHNSRNAIIFLGILGKKMQGISNGDSLHPALRILRGRHEENELF